MTAEQRLERDLPQILGDLSIAPYPDYIDDVLKTTAQRRQRPTWTFPERWLAMDIATERVPTPRLPWRELGVLALIVLLTATALAAYVGTRPRLPEPFGLAANGRIAMSSDGDIHMLDPLTGSSTVIVGGPDVDSAAMVSPDGRRVAFQRRLMIDDATLYHLVVANDDGSDLTVLTSEPLLGGFDSVAWAPDSRTLLVDHSKDEDLWLYDAFGPAAPRSVASNAEAYLAPFQPTDGSSILIYRDGALPKMVRLDLETSRETVLAEARISQDLGDARWSPDGLTVVYNAAPETDLGSQRLFVVNADGTDPRQITEAPGTWFDIDATWSPSGDRIAFDRYERIGTDWLVRPLAIYDVASGSTRDVGPLARDVRKAMPGAADADASFGEGFWFEWSPDGTSLIAIPTEGNAHPVLIDVATGEWRILDPIVAPDFVAEAWQRKAP